MSSWIGPLIDPAWRQQERYRPSRGTAVCVDCGHTFSYEEDAPDPCQCADCYWLSPAGIAETERLRREGVL